MGLFSKLFGQKENKAKELLKKDNAKPIAVSIKPNFEFFEKVVDNIVVSETLQKDLKIKLKRAFENPKSFYDDNNEFILSERGLTFPQDTLLTPKFVFVDTLQENEQMAEVDWKEEEEEIRFAINAIIKAKNYNIKLSDGTKYDDNDTFEIIELIDKEELNPLGYSLQILDIDSDSYVFTIVPLEKQQEVETMFAILK